MKKIKAADKIQESPWQEVVVRELNKISKDCAKELQTETGQIGNKGDYQLGLDEWPPTRILSLMLALSAWAGWIMHEKHVTGLFHFGGCTIYYFQSAPYQYLCFLV